MAVSTFFSGAPVDAVLVRPAPMANGDPVDIEAGWVPA